MWARAALNRSLAIAEEHGDALEQVRLLGPLHMFHLRSGDFKAALHYARRCSAIAETWGFGRDRVGPFNFGGFITPRRRSERRSPRA